MSTAITDGDSAVGPSLLHGAGVQDAGCQAAPLLTESLIHGLKARGVRAVAQASDIIATAADMQYDLADAADGAGSTLRHAVSLLTAMAVGLRNDLPRDG